MDCIGNPNLGPSLGSNFQPSSEATLSPEATCVMRHAEAACHFSLAAVGDRSERHELDCEDRQCKHVSEMRMCLRACFRSIVQ